MSAGFACSACGGFLGSARADGVRVCTACGASFASDGRPQGGAPRENATGTTSAGPTPPPQVRIRTLEAVLADSSMPRRSGPGFLGVLGVLMLAGIAVASAFAGIALWAWPVAPSDPDASAASEPSLTDDLAPTLALAAAEDEASAWSPPVFTWTADRASAAGHFYAIGWLTNPNDAAMMSPKVVLQQHDAAGAMVHDDFAYPSRMLLRPHERIPVSLLFDVAPEATKRTWVLSGSRAFGSPPPAVEGLVVEGLRVEDPEYGLPEAKGRVVNRGRQRADRVHVALLSYDRNDVLVAVDEAYVAAETLAPGETSHFSILLNLLETPVARRETLASASVAAPPTP